jgi:hypothetical protein
MAEIKNAIYRVTITEYDAGVQRTDQSDTKYFTTYSEAKAYADTWEEGGTRECFWRAYIEKM